MQTSSNRFRLDCVQYSEVGEVAASSRRTIYAIPSCPYVTTAHSRPSAGSQQGHVFLYHPLMNSGSLVSVVTVHIIHLLLLLLFLFMQSIYNYIPETNHVSRVCSFAAILWSQYMVHVMLFPMINVCYLLFPFRIHHKY